ncbi:MAG: hypothetical protein JRH20_01015 [Deltaproteobacteria bacterium]|nr:hypothetical protein [Deltaproteobacteria bacterium]
MKTAATTFVMILSMTLSSAAMAVCTKDTDCKGSRVCEQGRCVSMPGAASHAKRMPGTYPEAPQAVTPPAPPAAPPVAPGAQVSLRGRQYAPVAHTPYGVRQGIAARPTGPLSWPSAYGALYTVLSMHAWGGMPAYERIDVSFSEGTEGGMHAAGYVALHESFHIGGYLSYVSSELLSEYIETTSGFFGQLEAHEEEDLGLGLALKVGGVVGTRAWIGAAIDLGVAFNGDTIGPQAFVGLNLDLLTAGRGPAKFCLSFRIGPQFQYFFTDAIAWGTDDPANAWKVRMMAQLGVALGAEGQRFFFFRISDFFTQLLSNMNRQEECQQRSNTMKTTVNHVHLGLGFDLLFQCHGRLHQRHRL